MIGPIITKILTGKSCSLPTFDKSFEPHLIFLKTMLISWNKLMNKNDKVIPIT